MDCAACHAEAPAGARFCPQCGSALKAACPACGAAATPGARFCMDCGASLTGATAAPAPALVATKPPPAPSPPAGPAPERRLLSVLFCDLADSTGLSTRVDPEDYRDILGAYHRAAAAAVEAQGGFVAKFMGDGVLAYFGYPLAGEDDAERAVRAALAVCEEVGRLSEGGVALQARAGVATGPVIVGDLIGRGSAQEQGVAGETPNLAARLQGAAAEGQAVICEATQRLTGGLFRCEDLGPLALKGFGHAQRAFRVLAADEGVGRFEALRSARTPLVGREEEVEVLARRWARACDGEPQTVLISAEPGVGKSRLVAALRARIAGERPGELSAYCAPHGADNAFHPLVRALESRCGFTPSDTPAERLDRIEAIARRALGDPDAQTLALLASLLSTPTEARYPRLALSPQRIREETVRVLARLAVRETEGRPTLSLFEDLHWADPSTMDVLRSLVLEPGRDAPRLLVLTCRPEFTPPPEWLGRPNVTSLTLSRLRASEAEAMVERIDEEGRLSPAVRRSILARADGVPLFVEEIARAVLDSGAEGGTGALQAHAVPASLQASLLSRLDRLPSARELAQIGAAIGREFGEPLLAAVAGWPEDRLRDGLAQLTAADVVFASSGVGGERAYVFKHALVQDTAYGAMLRGQRQSLHARIADALLSGFPEEVEAHPETLGRHLAEGARPRAAVDAWRRAAVKSFAGGSWREGLSQMGQAMAALGALPEGDDRDRVELDLQMIIGGVSQGALGHSAPGAQTAYERAYALARALGDNWTTALAGNRLWIGPYGQNDLHGVIAAVEKVLAELPTDATPVERAIVSSQLCTPYTYIGDFVTSNAISDETNRLVIDVDRLIPPEYHFMHPTNSSLNSAMAALMAMGFMSQYRSLAEKQEIDMPRQGHMSRTITLTLLMYTRYLIGAWDLLSGYVQQMSATVSEMEGSAYYLELGRLMEIRLASRAGDREAGVVVDALVERPAVAFAKQHIPRYMMIAGDIHADLGDVARARGYYAEALTGGPFGVQHWLDSEVQRRMGDLACAEGDATAAAGWFEAAIQTARRQKATLFELRGAKSLAELRRSRSPGFDCAALLGPVCSRFPEPWAELDAARALCAAPLSG